MKKTIHRNWHKLSIIKGESRGRTTFVPNKKRDVKNSKRKHKGIAYE